MKDDLKCIECGAEFSSEHYKQFCECPVCRELGFLIKIKEKLGVDAA